MNPKILFSEYFVSGRIGNMTKAITANFIECINSSFEIHLINSLTGVFKEIIRVKRIVRMIAKLLFQRPIIIQIRYVNTADSSVVIQISHFLKEEYT